MAATDKKIAHRVAHYRSLLDALPQMPESLSQAPDNRPHRIIEMAGAKRRSEQLLARLDKAFRDAAIVTHLQLLDPGLAADERLFMLDAKHPIEGLTETRHLFTDERALHTFIWSNRFHLNDFQALEYLDAPATASEQTEAGRITASHDYS
jgi:hypothetical protein